MTTVRRDNVLPLEASSLPVESFVDAMQAQRRDEPARQAALVLHALPAVDRDWLLEQLLPVHRERLGELLDELAHLRIPASAALLDDVRRAVSTQAPAPVVSAAERRLEAADPKTVAALLEREPAVLVAALLGLRDWPWSASVLERLSPARRQQVQARLEARPADGVAGGLGARLLPLLDVRLAAAGVQAATSRRARATPRAALRRLQPLAWLGQLRTGLRAGISVRSTRVDR